MDYVRRILGVTLSQKVGVTFAPSPCSISFPVYEVENLRVSKSTRLPKYGMRGAQPKLSFIFGKFWGRLLLYLQVTKFVKIVTK